MFFALFIIICILKSLSSAVSVNEKAEFCKAYQSCNYVENKTVCGIKSEGTQFEIRLFDNECKLIQFGCKVADNKNAYGILNNKDICEQSILEKSKIKKSVIENTACAECTVDSNNSNSTYTCGIRQHGKGFKLRLFSNECDLIKYNCKNNITFYPIEQYYCDGLEVYRQKEKISSGTITKFKEELVKDAPEVRRKTAKKMRPVIIFDGIEAFNSDVNKTFENFAALTHVYNLSLQDVRPIVNDSTRRMLLRIFGPVNVFTPTTVIPKQVQDDVWHWPTINSCYHKCPQKCPDTYSPVCGSPGFYTRVQTLVFQNHCYMDAMQCKMKWDNKHKWASGSNYQEATFIMCLGTSLNNAYRFGPLIRTLQRMGRMKKKGSYHYKVLNMRHFNELVYFQPVIRG